MITAGVACIGLVLGLASCDTSPTGESMTTNGSITGSIVLLSGGIASRPVHGQGSLVVLRGEHLVSDTKVSSGDFKVSVPDGSYLVSARCMQLGTKPGGSLRAARVHVKGSEATSVGVLTCGENLGEH